MCVFFKNKVDVLEKIEKRVRANCPNPTGESSDDFDIPSETDNSIEVPSKWQWGIMMITKHLEESIWMNKIHYFIKMTDEHIFLRNSNYFKWNG